MMNNGNEIGSWRSLNSHRLKMKQQKRQSARGRNQYLN